MKKTLIVAAVAASFATAANAQSSVTLYGLIDAGFTYVNNEVASNVAKAAPQHSACRAATSTAAVGA
jgi:general bacterial porin, GBP family